MSDLSVQNIRHLDHSITRSLTIKATRAVPLLAAMCLAFVCQLPSGADIDATLMDPYLQKEFNWAMYIDLHEDKPFLNYPGSRLNPLTQISVTYSTFQRTLTNRPDRVPAQIYEEYWYHEETPIGLRRYRSIELESNQIGAIYLGGRGNNAAAAAKVLLRLAIELDLQQLSPSLVVVPLDKYDLIASELGRYSFFPRMIATSGRQFSIHLRSYPYRKNKDEYFYLQH